MSAERRLNDGEKKTDDGDGVRRMKGGRGGRNTHRSGVEEEGKVADRKVLFEGHTGTESIGSLVGGNEEKWMCSEDI